MKKLDVLLAVKYCK